MCCIVTNSVYSSSFLKRMKHMLFSDSCLFHNGLINLLTPKRSHYNKKIILFCINYLIFCVKSLSPFFKECTFYKVKNYFFTYISV